MQVDAARTKVNSNNEYMQNLLSNHLETLHATNYFASNDPNAGDDVLIHSYHQMTIPEVVYHESC